MSSVVFFVSKSKMESVPEKLSNENILQNTLWTQELISTHPSICQVSLRRGLSVSFNVECEVFIVVVWFPEKLSYVFYDHINLLS